MSNTEIDKLGIKLWSSVYLQYRLNTGSRDNGIHKANEALLDFKERFPNDHSGDDYPY